MPKIKSGGNALDAIAEENLASGVIRSVQHFDDIDELMRRGSDISSRRSEAIDHQSTSSEESETENDFTLEEMDPFFSLSQIESSLFATVLEDMLMTFRILGECNNNLRLDRVLEDLPIHLDRKFNVQPPAVQPNELDLIDPKRLHCKEYKMQKLEADRNNIENIIKSTYVGLSLARGFRPLWNQCQELKDREDYVQSLKENHMESKILAKTLRRQSRQQQVQQMSTYNETDSIVENKKKQIQDAAQMAAVQERYTVKWQTARSEQHKELHGETEASLSDSIQHYKSQSQRESIVHGDIEMLLNGLIHETLEQVEDIMNKYEIDIEAMDLKLQMMNFEVNEIVEANMNLNDTFTGREKEMKDWVEFKNERAKLQKYQDDMARAAAIVQAWWRGLLVRKQLGPFRVKNKPKGRKKK